MRRSNSCAVPLVRRHTTGSRSADPGHGFEDRMPVDGYLGARLSGREPLQPDELALQERVKDPRDPAPFDPERP